MKLGMQVGLGPGHTVLGGDPVPPPLKGHSPQFSAHICCGQMENEGRKEGGMQRGREVERKGGEEGDVERLHVKFHLNVFIVSAAGGQKPQFWADFDIWGTLIPTPFYR